MMMSIITASSIAKTFKCLFVIISSIFFLLLLYSLPGDGSKKPYKH